jgi:hypothetical protein
MNQKEELMLISKLDSTWKFLRDNQEKIERIIENFSLIPNAEKIDEELFKACIFTVNTELLFYKNNVEEILGPETEDVTEIINKGLSRIAQAQKRWEELLNGNKSFTEKFKILREIREELWAMAKREEKKINSLNQSYPNIEGILDFLILIECLSTILIEIKLRDIEFDLMEKENSEYF